MSAPSPTVSPAPGTSPPAPNGTSPPPASPPPPPAGNGTSPLPSPTVPATPPPVAATPPPSNSPPPPPDAATPPSSESPPSPPPPDARPSPPGSTSPPTIPSPPLPPPPDARPSPPSPPGSTSPPTTPSPPSPPSPGLSRPPPSPGSSRPPPSPGSISPPSPSNSNSTGIVMGAVIAGLFALVVVGVIFFCCCRKKKKKSDLPEYVYPPPPPKGDPYGGGQNRWQYNAPPPADNVGKFPPQLQPPPAYGSRPPHSPPGGPSPQSSLPPLAAITSSGGSSSNYSGSKAPLPPLSPGLALGFSKNTFSLEELAMATDGFSDANFLGQGAFGYVHKGILPHGKEVAIKQLKAGSWQGEREFQAEVEIISRVHHRHLVSLVGYCIADGQKMLVYEFLPNKTLEHHLHGKGRPTLEWSVRQKIALGAAKGLAYLHEDCHPKIIHRDIKAANILLDYNFEAKVADFGLAKDAPDASTHLSTRVMGTFGYLAPEYASSGKVSFKSDVYSFGVMLLELITGRRHVNSSPSHEDDTLVNWAMPLLPRAMEEGKYDHLVDPKLQNNYDRDEMAQMVACAAGSVRHLARHRPRMSQIVRTLEGGVSLDSLNAGGIAPRHSRIDGSSDYDSSSQQYNTFQRNEDIKRHYQLAFESQDHGSSEYGGATSEYGLNPSTSSSEGQQTQEVEVGSAKQG